jgi:hypothetical protein
MKKIIYLGFFLIVCSSLAAAQMPLQQDPLRVKVGGYLAADYAKSEAGGLYPEGTFQNPLIGVLMSGQLASGITFQTEASYYSDHRFDINQAWLGVQASEGFDAKLGLYVVPFGQFNENNLPYQIDTVNFPLNIEYLYPATWRDIGVTGGGTVSGARYVLYLGNGLAEGEYLTSGQQFRDNNRNKGWGGRLDLELSEGFSAGYSYYRGKVDDANSRFLVMQAGTVSWTTSDFYIKVEYNHSKSETPDPFADAVGWGYYIQSAMIWKNFRPVVSYQVLKYDDAFHGPGFEGPDSPGEGIHLDRTRWALGAVLMFAPNAYLKFEYDFNREKNLEIKNDTYLLQGAAQRQTLPAGKRHGHQSGGLPEGKRDPGGHGDRDPGQHPHQPQRPPHPSLPHHDRKPAGGTE